ncbi:MAG: hypothetical protein NTU80_13770 [Verrucomicrobia bacterium]|nr:hypothetical protein [Verrucomicrobiota bacterium]
MESHELLKDVLKRTSAKQIAADMNLSLSLIYKWAEPPIDVAGSGSSNPLDRIEQLIKSTGDVRVAHWVCCRAGGFFIANPPVKATRQALVPATNEIVRDFADLLGVISAASADQQVTAAEAKSIRAKWEELKTATEGFVNAAEKGAYRDHPPAASAATPAPAKPR